MSNFYCLPGRAGGSPIGLEGDAVTLEPVSLSLAESYQSIPALIHAQSWSDTLRIAHEDHADEVIKKD
jgi:hypothetical protein